MVGGEEDKREDRREVHGAGRDDSLQMHFSGKTALPAGRILFLNSMTPKATGSKESGLPDLGTSWTFHGPSLPHETWQVMAGISRVHLMGSNLPPTWILPERLHLPCSLGPKSGLDQTVMGREGLGGEFRLLEQVSTDCG